MQHSNIGLVALCSLTAAGACGGGTDEVVIRHTAGSGGSSSQVGGTGGMGGSVGGNGGSSGTGGSPVCEGPAPYNNTGEVREVTQCYVSERTQGEAECLPVNDPTLLGHLQTPIASTGFGTWFVIDVAETIPLPNSCEPLLECCSRIPQDNSTYRQHRCYDWLENPSSTTLVDGCPVWRATFKEVFACSETSVSDAGQSQDAGGDAATTERDDAGSQADPFHSLCCYRTCGFDTAI